ncbi:hypothetical protein OAV47_01915 [bacterium]|nr:hypothetical protein [bacterium]
MSRSVVRPTVHAPDAPRHVVDVMEAWLERTASHGQAFVDGDEFRLGFIWFRIAEDHKGLRVTSPRVGDPALIYVDDCSEALRLVAMQRKMLERFELEAELCNCKQTALVVRDLDHCQTTFIDRLASEVGDRSGWYVGAHDSKLDVTAPENLKLVSLWTLMSRRPEIVPYLLFPAGWQVSFAGSSVVMRGREVVKPLASTEGAKTLPRSA